MNPGPHASVEFNLGPEADLKKFKDGELDILLGAGGFS
jgi:hypothetical protein